MSAQYQQYLQQHTSTYQPPGTTAATTAAAGGAGANPYSSLGNNPTPASAGANPAPAGGVASNPYGSLGNNPTPTTAATANPYGSLGNNPTPTTAATTAGGAANPYGSLGNNPTSAAASPAPTAAAGANPYGSLGNNPTPTTAATANPYGSLGNNPTPTTAATTAAAGGAAANPYSSLGNSAGANPAPAGGAASNPYGSAGAANPYGSLGSNPSPQTTATNAAPAATAAAVSNPYGSLGNNPTPTSAAATAGGAANPYGSLGNNPAPTSTAAPTPATPQPAPTPAAAPASPLFSAEINGMLNAHKQGKKLEKKQGTGGVFPISIDPDTNEIWILMGLNSSNQYSHFHGWIDEGETYEQGTAREAWEVSRGLLGSQVDLWRAIMLGGTYSMPFVGSSQLILVGAVRAAERTMWANAFLNLAAYYDEMDEMKRVDWINAKAFRSACINFSMDKFDGYAVFETQKKPTTLIGTGKYYVQGFAPNAVLRPFLHNWLCSREGVAWLCDPRYVDLLEKGQLGKLMSLPALSQIKPEERTAIASALKIPNCKECGQDGHATGICVSIKDKKARRRGTLKFILKEYLNEQGQRQQSVIPQIEDNQSPTIYTLTKDDSSKWVEWLHAVVENVPPNQDKSIVPKQWNELEWAVTFRPRMKSYKQFVGKEVVALPSNLQ